MTTLETKKQRLEAYYKAELMVLSGQSYRIGTRSLTRADLATIKGTIKELEKEIKFLEGGSIIRAIRVIPRDL